MKPIEIPFYQLPQGITFWQAMARGLVPAVEAPAYLKWVRTLPCVITAQRGEHVWYHHLVGGGVKPGGGKTSDLLTFPLSNEYHMPGYPLGLHQIGHKEWERRHGTTQLEFVARTLVQAVYEGVLVLR